MRTISPPQTIGILGGGQLGQMMAFEAHAMGYRVHSYDISRDCPLALMSDKHYVGGFDDTDAMLAFSKSCDVLTYEFENIDEDSVSVLAQHVLIPQGVQALKVSSDRRLEYDFVKRLGVPVLDCVCVRNKEDVLHAMKQIQYPFILKALKFGYDGHGQIWVHSQEDVDALCLEGAYLMMRCVRFQKEISILCVRGKNGIQTYPCIENIHTNGILDVSMIPADVDASIQELAIACSRKVIEALDYYGVMAFEYFVEDGRLIFNEMAPRPHNSGHFSIEGTTHSQFRTHIEAICGLDVGEIQLVAPSVMVNVLGQHRGFKDTYGGVYHDYGKKEARHNRKMGHVTFVSDNAMEMGMRFRSEMQND